MTSGTSLKSTVPNYFRNNGISLFKPKGCALTGTDSNVSITIINFCLLNIHPIFLSYLVNILTINFVVDHIFTITFVTFIVSGLLKFCKCFLCVKKNQTSLKSCYCDHISIDIFVVFINPYNIYTFITRKSNFCSRNEI